MISGELRALIAELEGTARGPSMDRGQIATALDGMHGGLQVRFQAFKADCASGRFIC